MVRGRAALLIQRLELDGSIDALNALQCVHYVGVNSFGGSDPRLGLRQEVANERERSGWFIRDGDHHELLQVDLLVPDQSLPRLAATLPQSHGQGHFAVRVHQLGLVVVLLARDAHALHLLHQFPGEKLHVASARQRSSIRGGKDVAIVLGWKLR